MSSISCCGFAAGAIGKKKPSQGEGFNFLYAL